MTLRINIWPLAVIYLRNPDAIDGWGRARGPVVVMPDDYPPHMKPHELMHVAQWWQVTTAVALPLFALAYSVPSVPWQVAGLAIGAMSTLSTHSKRFRFRIESAGYGASVRASNFDPSETRRFALALSQSYGLGLSVDECEIAISKRAHDGRSL